MTEKKGYVKKKKGVNRVEKYNLKFYNEHTKKERKNEVMFISIDSCIAIDMVKILNGTAPYKTSPQYYSKLKRLLSQSIFGKGGTFNKRGNVCFCIMPHVLQELSKENGEIYSKMKKFVEERTIVFNIDSSYRRSFDRRVGKIVEDYCHLGYFLSEDGGPTTDAYNVAEPSFFNLTFLSRDRHVCKNLKDKNPERKIRDIRMVNRKALSSCFDGEQAEPRRIDSVFYLLDNGKSLPKYINEDYLIPNQQSLLWAIKNNTYSNYIRLGSETEK